MTTSSDTELHAPKNAAEQFAQRRRSPAQRIQHVLHSHPSISPLLVLIASFVIFTIINPRMAQPSNISLILQQAAVIAALAIGQTLIILTAGIDLSVGAATIFATSPTDTSVARQFLRALTLPGAGTHRSAGEAASSTARGRTNPSSHTR